MSRISATFERLKNEGRAAFIPFLMGGDPSYDVSLSLLTKLPEAGADLIEIGVPFTDPMADGVAIQLAGQRALNGGQTLRKTLQMVRSFRTTNETTPIILMGYYNPFYAYGVEAFLSDAVAAGVDGLIIVDLPPEEDAELCLPARTKGIDFIRLAAPTTDDERLPAVVKNTSGFVYYVSVAGITGGQTGAQSDIESAVTRIRTASSLPVAVGFGVKTEQRAADIAAHADAVVVGSALVDMMASHLSEGENKAIDATLDLASRLSAAINNVKR